MNLNFHISYCLIDKYDLIVGIITVLKGLSWVMNLAEIKHRSG